MRPHGHEAVVERIRAGIGIVEVRVRRKGSRRSVERAAALVPCFVRIVSISAFSEVEWLRAFGNGRM